jgi:hypothetical protein
LDPSVFLATITVVAVGYCNIYLLLPSLLRLNIIIIIDIVSNITSDGTTDAFMTFFANAAAAAKDKVVDGRQWIAHGS